MKDEQFDQLVKNGFQQTLEQAIKGELFAWRDHPLGRLAEIIVLDQFSRNIYRDSAQAFAQDPQSLLLAQEAVRMKVDKGLSAKQKAFLYMPYMPYMHSDLLSTMNRPLHFLVLLVWRVILISR